MKNVLTFVVLLGTLSLASCNSKNSSKKTCSFNDEPVDCSTMNPQVSDKGLTLSTRVKASIAVNGDILEILENTHSIESETKNGKNYECVAFTNSGDRFKTKVNKKTLQILKDNEANNYKLLSNFSKGIEGKWENIEKENTGSTTTTLIITEETMEIIVNCQFN